MTAIGLCCISSTVVLIVVLIGVFTIEALRELGLDK